MPAPILWLDSGIKDIDKFTMESVKLENYNSHGTIRAEMAV
jgi:thymidylate synthase